MKRLGHCMGCMAQWRQKLRFSAPARGAKLTAFVCLLKRVIGPIKVHVDNKGIIVGLRKGCMVWQKEGISVVVEHVKAHRTQKEKKTMSQFDKFVTEGKREG